MRSPLSLIAVAVLFILVGAESAWQTFAQISRQHIVFNPIVLCLFAGIGLLFHLQVWRYIALICVWSLITLGVCNTLAFAFTTNGQGFQAALRTMPVQVAAGTKWGLLFMLLLLGWMHWVLARLRGLDPSAENLSDASP